MFDLSLAGAIAAKTTLLLLVAAFVAAALTKKSAAFRHALWSGTLLLSLLMPLAILTLPKLDVIPASWLWQETVADAAGGLAGHAIPALDFWSIGSKLWMAGTIFFLLRMLVAQLGLLRWQLRAWPLRSLAWTGTLQRVSSQLRMPQSLRVLESPEFTNPCTWGFLRPVLLLPAGGDSWTEAERRLALMHELAHVRRRDYLTANLGRLACAIHWYNPLVWLAAHKSRKLQEHACDDFVLQFGALPSHYATFLRRAAASEQNKVQRLAAAVGIVRRSELRERVDSILDSERRRTPLSRARACGLWLTSACIALFLGAVAQESPAQTADSLPTVEDNVAPVPPVPPVPPVLPVPPVPPAPFDDAPPATPPARA